MKQKKRTTTQAARMSSTPMSSVGVATVVILLAAAIALAVLRSSLVSPATKVDAGQRMTEAADAAAFGPTIPNATPVPAGSPPEMVWIPGGEFSMGAMDPPAVDEVGMHAANDARPIHRVYVDGFWIDKTNVTNEEFARFGADRLRDRGGAEAARGGGK
jgi:sulfatase modifying factor 1